MKHYPAPPVAVETVEAMRRLVTEGATPGTLIQKMREAGLSIVPSIRLLSQFFGIPVAEAKRMVHLSDTWLDCRAANDLLHESAYEAAVEEGFQIVEIEEPVAGVVR